MFPRQCPFFVDWLEKNGNGGGNVRWVDESARTGYCFCFWGCGGGGVGMDMIWRIVFSLSSFYSSAVPPQSEGARQTD